MESREVRTTTYRFETLDWPAQPVIEAHGFLLYCLNCRDLQSWPGTTFGWCSRERRVIRDVWRRPKWCLFQ